MTVARHGCYRACCWFFIAVSSITQFYEHEICIRSHCACVTVSLVSGEVAQYVCRHGRTVDGNARRSASFSTNCSSNGMKTLLGSSRLCTDTARIDLSLSVVLVLVCCLPKGGLVDARLCADTARTTLSHSVVLVLVRSLPGTYHGYHRFFAVGAKRLRCAELLCTLQHRRSCSEVQLGRARCAFRYGRPFVQSGVSRDDHRHIIDDMLHVPVRDQQPSRTVLTVFTQEQAVSSGVKVEDTVR